MHINLPHEFRSVNLSCFSTHMHGKQLRDCNHLTYDHKVGINFITWNNWIPSTNDNIFKFIASIYLSIFSTLIGKSLPNHQCVLILMYFQNFSFPSDFSHLGRQYFSGDLLEPRLVRGEIWLFGLVLVGSKCRASWLIGLQTWRLGVSPYSPCLSLCPLCLTNQFFLRQYKGGPSMFSARPSGFSYILLHNHRFQFNSPHLK